MAPAVLARRSSEPPLDGSWPQLHGGQESGCQQQDADGGFGERQSSNHVFLLPDAPDDQQYEGAAG